MAGVIIIVTSSSIIAIWSSSLSLATGPAEPLSHQQWSKNECGEGLRVTQAQSKSGSALSHLGIGHTF